METALVMTVPQFLAPLFSELSSLYAFWALRLVDCLGHSPVANRARGYVLSLLGFDIGAGCVIRPKLQIQRLDSSVKIGSKTKINYDVFFEASARVAIGNFCQVGHGVRFGSVDYEQLPLALKLQHSAPPPPRTNIIVEDFVWIACNVLILGGVTIGKGSVVGAGSVVMEDIPPHSFAIGNPAKVIRQLSPPSEEAASV